MHIAEGYSLHTYFFSGASAPTGAAVTLGVEQVGAITIVAEAAASRDAWQTEIMPELVDSLTFDGVLVKRGPNATGPIQFSPSGVVGTIASDGISPQVACLVRKVTGFGGRKNRGRMFVPGLYESVVDEAGLLFPAKQVTLQTAFNDFQADMEVAGNNPVLLHTLDTDLPTQITSFGVDSTVATQRKRLRR